MQEISESWRIRGKLVEQSAAWTAATAKRLGVSPEAILKAVERGCWDGRLCEIRRLEPAGCTGAR